MPAWLVVVVVVVNDERKELEVDCNQPFEKQITTFVFICCYGSNGPFRARGVNEI